MTLPSDFELLPLEQQETILVAILIEKEKEIDKVKWLLAVVRGKMNQ